MNFFQKFATVFYFFSTRHLKGTSADRHRILLHGRKHVQFYNANWVQKFGGLA